ncbi:ribosomal large subunit pseudouridine synthase D [Lentibacillus persicus]|uniref:RNA pseudouridylate synthase n=1 Tax=Lentibacillus persicus TaxID=640948 RepID=A0A1I1YF43_9BACI|nr:RluA family pseudouridine synthase [Lentibacillus persicus]SFE18019.1 ribosomal large subunit pseudouridine synthase D [Lentibacillus persicus]
MGFSILYEDNHVLVVEKPVNIPVQEDKTKDDDLLSMLKNDIKVRHQKPGNVYLALVHRLDRPVGGVMVFAKTSKAASRLSDAIRRGAFEKQYLAVVRGNPPRTQDTLEHFLLKDHKENKVKVVSANTNKAKKALLDYKIVGKHNGLSLLSVNLHTGRPHQIRVQLANIGCPIYGDQKYGQNVNKPGQQIALWSHKLAFEHPTKKDMRENESLPPEDYPWHLWPEFCKRS